METSNWHNGVLDLESFVSILIRDLIEVCFTSSGIRNGTEFVVKKEKSSNDLRNGKQSLNYVHIGFCVENIRFFSLHGSEMDYH